MDGDVSENVEANGIIRELKRVRRKLDELSKEQFSHMTDPQIIRFTNKLLNHDFSLDLKVKRLPTESVSNGKVRRTDIEYEIADYKFDIEFESGNKGQEYIIKLFEYAFRAANNNRQADEDEIILKLPEQCVIYIRGDKNYRTELQASLEIPQTDGTVSTVKYCVPTRRIVDYDAQRLIDEFALLLMPFLPYKYLNQFDKISDNVSEELISEAKKLFAAVKKTERLNRHRPVNYGLISSKYWQQR